MPRPSTATAPAPRVRQPRPSRPLDPEAARIIRALGGPTLTAALFDPPISSAAVSQWLRAGIPDQRRHTLRLLRPDLFPEPGTPQAPAPALPPAVAA